MSVLGGFLHHLHHIVDEDGHTVYVFAYAGSQILSICFPKLKEQRVGDVLDEGLQSSHQSLGSVCWLHVELAQDFLLELWVGHAPSNKLVQVLKSSLVLFKQIVGLGIALSLAHELVQVVNERLHLRVAAAHGLQQGRVNQLMHQQFRRQT